MKILKELKEKNIIIVGYGREGRDTHKFLRKRFPQKRIGIADLTVKDIDDKRADLFFGEDYLENINDYDLIIKSPGVPISKLGEYKGKITSQADIFLNLNRDKVIGVTGTKGKSTTCFVIYNVLKKNLDQPVHLLGNIGEPVMDFMDKDGIFVYELSSFQLETVTVSPSVAIILNLFIDHLDQHESFKEYFNAKKRITAFQKKWDKLIYNSKDDNILKMIGESKAIKIPFDPKKKARNGFFLDPILKAVELFNISPEEVEKFLKSFSGLPHRIEHCGNFRGIDFYNDSAATVPEATIFAINNLNPETLIVGGLDKGGDYRLLAEKIVENEIENVILFPDTGFKIKEIIESQEKEIDLVVLESMEEAVRLSFEKTSSKGVCLMSPASSSFNMFKNYKERGNLFKKFVKKYGQK